MAKLGIGVLGVGEMGKRHAENLRRLVPEARLLAIADVAEERARQVATELEIEHAFGSLDAMLECKGLDAVVIATPDKFHAQAIIAAARAGKSILCEKPLALEMAEARAALDALAKAGVRLQVGFMRRYDPAYAAAMKRIEAGEIGVPVIFKSLGRDKEWSRWLMQDEVTEVHAYTTVAIRPEVAQFGDVVASVVNLKYQLGAIGNIESYAQAVYGYDVRTEIVGSKGSILVGSLERTPATFLTAAGGTRNLADHFLTSFADAYLLEVQDFVRTILTDRMPRIGGDDGLKALAIAVAAEKSHRDAKPVRVEA